MNRLIAIGILLLPLGLSADPPVKRGGTCSAARLCAAGLSCARVVAGDRCEQVCDAKRPSSCPEDERCVKDGASSVCRPIYDGPDL
jgi:hypothetical protein